MRIAISIAVVVLAGCVSAPERAIRQIRITEETVAGQQRLFSTFGFYMLDESLKKKLLACYTPDGRLNHALLRQRLPEAQIMEIQDAVAVTLPSGSIASFLLRDGPLVSLDPKMDPAIRLVADEAASRGRLPVIPITR